MKKLISLNKGTKYLVTLFILFFLLSSCEDDFTTLGGDFINDLDLPDPYVVQNLASYSDNVQSVQTNSLNNYLLGKFSDPVFGDAEMSILSQFHLQNTSPNFGTDPVIDSVILTLPLYSALVDVDTYRLDSIFGDGTFKISVYESNQFLSNIDPGENGDFENSAVYYSDQFPEFENNISFSSRFAVSDEITPADSTGTQILFDQIAPTSIDTLRVSPRIRLKLPNAYFQQKILNNQGSDVLASQSSFKNFLRGFYIKTDIIGSENVMLNLDLSNVDANITLFYKSQRPSTVPDEEDELVETFNKFSLNFAGNTINFYDVTNGLDLGSQDTANGEENLFVKGGEGITTIIEPFNGPDMDDNGVPDEIDELRQNDWLVNEANIILYVDEEFASQIDQEPLRIFAYDIDREQVLIDYNLDEGISQNPSVSRLSHLGPLTTDDDGNSFYKIRITSHINNIINNDSINTRIGVVVTENVNRTRPLEVRESQLGEIESLIENTISTPRGTVFHGNLSDDEELRLKLQIYYTEPNSMN